MAHFLASKVAAEVVDRRWTVPGDDLPTVVSTSASGITVNSAEVDGSDIVLTLSAGTAGATASVTVTVTTGLGQTIIETLYVPVIVSTAVTADTARDYIGFALRKIVGIGESAETDELDHGLEVLNALIARWRAGGADIGAAYPLTANTVIYCPEWAVSALRYNLLVECSQVFGVEPTAIEYELARRGRQLVLHKDLPDVRAAVYY